MTRYPVLQTLYAAKSGSGVCNVYSDKAREGQVIVVDHVYYMARPNGNLTEVYLGGMVEGDPEAWWPIVSAYEILDYCYETVPMRLPIRGANMLRAQVTNDGAGSFSHIICLYHFEDLSVEEPDYLVDWITEKEARGERPQCAPIAPGVCI